MNNETKGNDLTIKHLYMRDGSVNREIFSKKVVIWGTGNDGERFFNKLSKDEKNRIICWWDSNPQRTGEKNGINIEGVASRWPYEETNLVLSFSKWNEVIGFVSEQDLGGGNVYADFPYWDVSNTKCLICGNDCKTSKARFREFIVEREFAGNPPETSLCKCDHCGFGFSSYRPNEIEMGRLYDGYRGEKYFELRHKYEPKYTREINGSTLMKETISSRRQSIVEFVQGELDLSSVNKLLDYGGDEGQMIPDEFVNADKAVFDISGSKVCTGRRLVSDKNMISDHSWDFVMCCHLLEHVSDPMGIIEELQSAAASGGWIYIEVPYETAWERYSEYGFHEHINFFSKGAFDVIGEKRGLRCIKTNVGASIQALYAVE